MDEPNDIYDMSQLAVFIREVNDNFDGIEELLGLESMRGSTKSRLVQRPQGLSGEQQSGLS